VIARLRNCLIPLAEMPQIVDAFKCAAVLMPLVKLDDGWQVILTRRAEHLKHHPGQISFPGGGFEIQDSDLSETALRETYEEIGIPREQVQLIGRLPQQQTVSGYNVTPYVGVVEDHYQLNIDYNEVAEVFTAPLDFLTDPTNQEYVTESIKGQDYRFYVIKYKHYNIWGATARILVNFTRRLARPDDHV